MYYVYPRESCHEPGIIFKLFMTVNSNNKAIGVHFL